jgi:CHAT domain-containing protein/Flp pilus assembly protein TadD
MKTQRQTQRQTQRHRQRWWVITVVMWLNIFSGFAHGRLASAEISSGLAQLHQSHRTAQIEGNLTPQSQRLEDGTYYNIHTLEGIAGESLTLELTSDDFNAYLILLDPQINRIADDDDGGGNTHARLVITLPVTGTYLIGVQSVLPGETGHYRLSWRPATAAEIAQARALAEAKQLNQQVLNLFAAGRYREATPLAERALALLLQVLPANHTYVARSENNLAEVYAAQGRYEEAESLYGSALTAFQQSYGPGSSWVAQGLEGLGKLYFAQGRYREAEPFLEEALSIRRALLGNTHLDVALSLNNLGELYRLQGRYSEAVRLHQEALGIRRQLLGEQHADVAQSLSNLALTAVSQGRYGEAETYFQQAIAINRQALGSNHPDLGYSLNGLGHLYRLLGQYDQAERLYREVLTLRQQALGLNHPDTLRSLNNLAELYAAQGRYAEAERLHQEALAGRRQVLGDNHPEVAQSLNNLASLYVYQGRLNEAEPLYQEALAIRRQGLGENHPEIAQSLNNLAYVYRFQGRFPEAEALFNQALALYRQTQGELSREVASVLNNLADLYVAQGRYGDAEPRQQQSLDLLRKLLGDVHPDVATSYHNLAALYAGQGQFLRAKEAFEHSLDIQEQHLALTLATLPESQRQAYVAHLTYTTNIVLSFHLQAFPEHQEAANLAFTTVLRRKGRILDMATDTLKQLRERLTPDDQQQLDQLTELRRQLATLLFDDQQTETGTDYARRIATLKAEIDEQEASLARRSADFRVDTQPITLASAQQTLPADATLVEWVLYQPFDFTDGASTRQSAWHYAAYLLNAQGQLQWVDLGEADLIHQAVADFRRALQARSARLPLAARTLDALVMQPIRQKLDNPSHLLLSPDGQLNLIPFEALVDEQDRYLVERYQLTYLSSGRELLTLTSQPMPSRQGPIVLANPDYNQVTTREAVTHQRGGETTQHSTDLRQLQVAPLPGTAAEADEIAALLPHATRLTGALATESALKQVHGPQLLHIATHGFFLTDVPLVATADFSGILGGSNRASIFVIQPNAGSNIGSGSQPATAQENPLLRSGLALAGFNTRQSGQEDGVFTALEAAGLDLYGTQLVVLSACETGLGDVVNGEGVYGLRRAFAIAGAASQVISLWKVDDQGTEALMTRYYRHLLDGMGRSEALRQVQLEFIHESGSYSHPYYWAAFIASGDWRPLP